MLVDDFRLERTNSYHSVDLGTVFAKRRFRTDMFVSYTGDFLGKASVFGSSSVIKCLKTSIFHHGGFQQCLETTSLSSESLRSVVTAFAGQTLWGDGTLFTATLNGGAIACRALHAFLEKFGLLLSVWFDPTCQVPSMSWVTALFTIYCELCLA